MRKSFLIGVFLVIASTLIGQQHPPNIKWKKIETQHFKVIAPAELSDQLNETAKMLEYIYSPVSRSLLKPEKKLSLFLFNQTTMSNGYVSQAPTYSAYYHTPFQDANAVGGSDWLQTLSLHEYRHYVQFNKLNDGFTYIGSSIFGDIGKAILMNWSVPAWVFEGDAICSETALSAGGRGRLPSFTRDIRANELENKRYNYDKAYLGSYKDFVPNHYYLGYIMSSGIRKQNGIRNWNNALIRSSKFSFWPYSFGSSLKKYGSGKMKISYNNILNDYDSIWTDKEKKHLVTNFNSIKPYRKVYTNYKYPYKISEDATICLKTGMATPPTLCIVSDKFEKELIQINPIDRVHSNGKIVTWASYKSDIRWGQKAYSDILVYNIQTEALKRITQKQKYFAPAISPGGDKIAVVEYTSNMECNIVIIDSENGSILSKHPIKQNYFARMPSWSEKEDKIVFTQTFGQNISVSVLDLKTSTINEVVSASPNNVTSPVFLNEFIIYNSPELGVDALIAIDTITKEKFVVASSNYGVYEASVSADSKFISFQDYSTKGFNIGQTDVYPQEWLPISEYQNVHDKYYQYLVEQEGKGNIFKNYNPDSIQDFEESKYRPILNSIKVHSWIPYPVTNGIGISVFSRDFLNTTAAQAGIEYHPRSTTSRGFLNLSYAGLFPVFDAEISYGRQYEPFEDSINNTSVTGLNEKSLSFGITVPLNLSRRIYYTNLVFNTSYNYINQDYTGANPGDAITKNNVEFSAINIGMLFINYKQASRRDIYPRFGQELSYNHWRMESEEDSPGIRNSAVGKLYLPGFFMHHSLQFEAAYENNHNFSGGIFTAETDIEFVRGYNKPIADYYYNAKAIYALPLFYPDLSLGPVAYIKRVRASVFYDFGETYTKLNNQTRNYNSIGGDLVFDFHAFRFLQYPLSLGMRWSYLIEDESVAAEIILLDVVF